MLETRLIRNVRARQEAAAADALADLLTEMFPDLLMAALKQPAVRTAICNIVAADRRSTAVANPRRSVPGRGGRRV